MKIAICDDEKWYIRLISEYLEEYQVNNEESFSIHGYQDPNMLIADFRSLEYDIVYLDIELEDTSGIKIAKELKSANPNVLIIFITSHMQYVQDSYTVRAFQYLTKPLEDKEFFMQELTRAIDELKNGQVSFEFVLSDGAHYFQTNEILYISTSYKTFKLQTVGGSYFGSLKPVLKTREQLKEYNFYKIHRSTTINLAHVLRFDRDFVTMDNDEVLPISRDRTKEFRKTFLRYKNVRNVEI